MKLNEHELDLVTRLQRIERMLQLVIKAMYSYPTTDVNGQTYQAVNCVGLTSEDNRELTSLVRKR